MPPLHESSHVSSPGRTQGAVEGKVGDRIELILAFAPLFPAVDPAVCSLPAVFLWMGYTGIQFHVYESCLRWSSGSQPDASAGSLTSLASGGIAGFAATIATYPLDITRTICAQHEAGAAAALRTPTRQCSPPPSSASFHPPHAAVAGVAGVGRAGVPLPCIPHARLQRVMFQGLPAALVNNVHPPPPPCTIRLLSRIYPQL